MLLDDAVEVGRLSKPLAIELSGRQVTKRRLDALAHVNLFQEGMGNFDSDIGLHFWRHCDNIRRAASGKFPE